MKIDTANIRHITYSSEWSKMILILFLKLSYKKASDIIAKSASIIKEVYAKQGLKRLMQIQSIRKATALKIEE
jgi:hypothetical protein